MANTVAPFGFKPIRRLDGAAWTSCHTTRKMQITAGALNRGDVVKTLADGTVAVSAAAAAAANCGIYVGCHYLSLSMGYPIWTNYWPGSGAGGSYVDAFIIDDPNVVYEVQASAGPITMADIGASADVVVTASTTGFSKWALGAPTVGAGSDALPFKIVALGNSGTPIPLDGYDITSANNIVEVCWNSNMWKAGMLAT